MFLLEKEPFMSTDAAGPLLEELAMWPRTDPTEHR